MAKKKPKKMKIINLKKIPKSAGETQLRKALEEASKRKVAIIVLNAPFKLAA